MRWEFLQGRTTASSKGLCVPGKGDLSHWQVMHGTGTYPVSWVSWCVQMTLYLQLWFSTANGNAKVKWILPSLRFHQSLRELRDAINLEEAPNTVFGWDLWEAFWGLLMLVTTLSLWLLWMKQSQRIQYWRLSTDRISSECHSPNSQQLFQFARPLSSFYEMNKCPWRSLWEESSDILGEVGEGRRPKEIALQSCILK